MGGGPTKTTEPRGPERPLPVARKAALWGALLAVILVPRLVAFRGVAMSARLDFADMPLHLVNLDKLSKLRSLSSEQVRDPFFDVAPHQRRLQNSQRWPKGTYHVARLWSRAFGPLSLWTTLLTNLLFTLVLTLGVLGLGAAMVDWRTGFWAALLTALCPPLWASSFYFSLDYPLVAMTAVGLLLLWHTRGLTRGWACVLLAVWSALALFIKPSYALFLVGPGIWALVRGLRGWPREAPMERSLLGRIAASRWPLGRRPAWPGWLVVGSNLVLVLGLGLSLTVWLCDLDPGRIATELSQHFNPPAGSEEFPVADISPWTVRWVLALPSFVAMNHPWPLLLLAAPGLVLLHGRRHPLPLRGLLLSCIWGAYVILTLMSNKLDRYLHPLYPLLCLLTVWGVVRLVPRRWQTAVLTWVAVAYVAILYAAHRFPPPWGGRLLSIPATYTDLRMPSQRQLAGLRRHTYHPTCAFTPLLDQVARLSRKDGWTRPLGVGYLAHPERPERVPLDYERLGGLVVQVVRDRFVLPLDVERHLLPPSLIVVHPLERDPRGFCPRARVLARRQVTVRCAGRVSVKVGVALLRPREPGARCR